MDIGEVKIEDNPDGSATLSVEVDYETIKLLASIGILKLLSDGVRNLEKSLAEEDAVGEIVLDETSSTYKGYVMGV